MITVCTDIQAPAYLIRGGAETLERVMDAIAEKGIEHSSPDVYARSFETLSVDEVREVIRFVHFKPLGERKYVVLMAGSVTPEAQNALLKVVEEGSGASIFFFILPYGALVLPTLMSRCVVFSGTAEASTEEGIAFLKMGYQERLARAEKFTKDHDREGARVLVRSLLSLADGKKFSSEMLRDVLEADRFLALSGSSPKSIIGHLALVL